MVTEPERGAANMSGGQTQAPSRMSLGTQVGSDLSITEGSSLALPQSAEYNPGPCLAIDLPKPTAEVISQMCAQLQLALDPLSGRARVAPLSDEDLVVFEEWVERVGLEKLPQVQPKQVTCSGVCELVQVLKGAQIHLVYSEDCDSNTSAMDTTHAPYPRDTSPPTLWV